MGVVDDLAELLSTPDRTARRVDDQSASILKAKVLAVHPGSGVPGVADVTVDGVHTIPGVPYLVQPTVNDLVVVLVQGPIRYILGKPVP